MMLVIGGGALLRFRSSPSSLLFSFGTFRPLPPTARSIASMTSNDDFIKANVHPNGVAVIMQRQVFSGIQVLCCVGSMTELFHYADMDYQV